MSHPYSRAPDTAFWSRSVAKNWSPSSLAPEVYIRPGDKIASAGSCFASNMVPHIEKAGFQYIRAELANPLFRVPAEGLGYEKFSAAYGHIYTARQLLQTIQRALGLLEPAERYWKQWPFFVDPFRPGLRYKARSVFEFDALTKQHLNAVLEALRQADVFVFTLGLTEAWTSRADGAVYPACPGTIAGKFDPSKHAFVNFSANESRDDLLEFVRLARTINQDLRVILTVSPVPLVATASDRHVVWSTAYSKATLRVAAEEVCTAVAGVTYFPSYELVAGPQAPPESLGADRRTVSEHAIQEVMAVFLKKAVAVSAPAKAPPPLAQALSQALINAECEEAMVERPEPVGRLSQLARMLRIK